MHSLFLPLHRLWSSQGSPAKQLPGLLQRLLGLLPKSQRFSGCVTKITKVAGSVTKVAGTEVAGPVQKVAATVTKPAGSGAKAAGSVAKVAGSVTKAACAGCEA